MYGGKLTGTRRRVLQVVGTGLLAGLAGCGTEDGQDAQTTPGDGGGGGGGGDDGTGGETSTPTEGDGGTPTEAEQKNSLAYNSNTVKVTDVQFVEGDYAPAIEGVVTNVSGDTLDYVSVEVNGYNDNDEAFDEALDNHTDLPDGDKWRFEAPFTDADSKADIAYWKGKVTARSY